MGCPDNESDAKSKKSLLFVSLPLSTSFLEDDITAS